MIGPNVQTGGDKGIRATMPLPPDTPKALGERDTRRWCRGKVGVEHDAVWQFWLECFWKAVPSDWQIRRCLNCGRHLGMRTVPSNRPSHDGEIA